MSTNLVPVTCEGCYEKPAVITIVLRYGAECPLCEACGIQSVRDAKSSSQYYVGLTEPEEAN